MAVSIALICVLGYLLGGINGAILLSKLVEKDDVRRHGSGNAGFTNFFRNYGKRTSLLVILIDAAKAADEPANGEAFVRPKARGLFEKRCCNLLSNSLCC